MLCLIVRTDIAVFKEALTV